MKCRYVIHIADTINDYTFWNIFLNNVMWGKIFSESMQYGVSCIINLQLLVSICIQVNQSLKTALKHLSIVVHTWRRDGSVFIWDSSFPDLSLFSNTRCASSTECLHVFNAIFKELKEIIYINSDLQLDYKYSLCLIEWFDYTVQSDSNVLWCIGSMQYIHSIYILYMCIYVYICICI